MGLKIVTSVADGNGTTTVDPERIGPVAADLEVDGSPWHHQPLRTIGPHAVPEQEALVVRDRLRAAQAFARRNGIDRVLGGPAGRLGVVCAGKTSTDVLQALSDLGVARDRLAEAGVRVLKLGMTYPLVEETIREFAATVDELVVIEEKRPFVERQIRSILHESRSPVPVSGKRDLAGNALAPLVGELDAATVASILVRLLPDLGPGPSAAPKRRWLPLADLPPRPPAFCSGCPHNRSTVFPDDALVGGGVGCHGIMYFEARHQGMKSLPPTPMGAEGVPWVGLAPFVAEPHLFQNIGDGTLSHSGTLAIRSCVAAGVNVTFKILYNAAVAMTGGQDVTGLMDVPSLTRALDAEGVRKVVVCAEDPRHYGRRANWARGVEVLGRDELPAVQEKLRLVPGVTVIIYDQRCAAEARRLRKKGLLAEPPRRVVINDAVCEGCGDCSVKSNCLSVLPVQTEFGEKRAIHDPSCNRDYSCLDGDCPSFVTVTPRRARPWRRGAGAVRTQAWNQLPSGELETPSVPPVGEHGFNVYFTGIGGTGVVTASRMMESAAQASGLAVSGLDQTGLSQKAGAVVSHLRLAADKEAIASAVVGAAAADLYLSGDILQAAADRHLEKVESGRTVAVIDTHVTPTAGMLQTDTAGPGLSSLEQAIGQRVGDDRTAFVDSTRIAESLFSNHLLANVVLLGVAYQRGWLPLASERLREVMQGQGKGEDDNWRAFQWGRWAVQDPDAVEAALVATENGVRGVSSGPFEPSARAQREAGPLVDGRRLPPALRELLQRRAAQVIDYQDTTRAAEFLDLVQTAAAGDDEGHGWAITTAVAEGWFKLLTYKDEYEVARLHLEVDYDDVARRLGITGPYAVTYHLHPPVLRRAGMRKKLPMGTTYRIAFHALRRMKGLRGTPFDVFGWDRDRRMERALIRDYREIVETTMGRSELPYATRCRIAESVMGIKGYGPVKEEAVKRWRVELTELRSVAAVPA